MKLFYGIFRNYHLVEPTGPDGDPEVINDEPVLAYGHGLWALEEEAQKFAKGMNDELFAGEAIFFVQPIEARLYE